MKHKDVWVGPRHRKDMGDIAALAASIDRVGLLHPIVVTPDNKLIAGERRLEACKLLGWGDVPATVVSLEDIVRGENDENAIRKDFLPSEIDSIRRALEPVVATPVGRPGEISESFANKPEKGRTVDKVGSFAGVSGRTVEKIKAVVEAAEENPEKFGHLVDEMDRTGKVNGAHRKLKQANDEKRVLSLVPAVGRHKTLIIDPPWDYEWLSLAGRAAPGYSTMTHEELLAMPVPSWADDNCHMYLWTTNNFMTRAVDLMAHWGFQHKTVLTWVKPKFGLGSYFRNSTEHVLFGVKGDMSTRVNNVPTHFEAPTRDHSEKPDCFYEIVRSASYPTCGEAFQRTERKWITNLYVPSE